MTTLGERIRYIRQSHNLKQREFAEVICISPTSISQLENNRNNIAKTTKELLCKRFQINPEWLMTGEGEMSAPETVEHFIPELVEILNENPYLLKAIASATKNFSKQDWKRLNDFVATLGDES